MTPDIGWHERDTSNLSDSEGLGARLWIDVDTPSRFDTGIFRARALRLKADFEGRRVGETLNDPGIAFVIAELEEARKVLLYPTVPFCLLMQRRLRQIYPKIRLPYYGTVDYMQSGLSPELTPVMVFFPDTKETEEFIQLVKPQFTGLRMVVAGTPTFLA